MATEHNSIWSRMGIWLKNAGRPTEVLDHPHEESHVQMVTLEDDPAHGNGNGHEHGNGHGHEPRNGDHAPHSLFPARRRQEQAIQRLEQGFQEVVGVISAIHRHLETQDQRTTEIADSLKHLADTMSRLPDAAVSQGETLNAIAYQMQLTSERARRSEESLARLPELAEAQKEAMSAVARQMDASQQRDHRMVETMDGLRKSVESLGTSTATSTDVLRSIHEQSAARENHLGELVKAQGRRFTWLFVLMLLCAGTATAVGTIALLRS